MSLAGTVANARTFLSNFSIPCLYIALASLLAGGCIGSWTAWKIQDGRVARAEANLSSLKADIATQTATITRQGAMELQAALEAIRAHDQIIDAKLDAIPGKVAGQLAPQFTTLRGLVNAPAYDCLRIPLPDDYLRLLERPGGSAAIDRAPEVR